MALAIILRKQSNVNRFRDLMIDVIRLGQGNEALLCSGFFQENRNNNPYRASQERQFASELVKNHIDLTTVGVYHYSWKSSYQNFRDSLLNAGVQIHAKYKNGLR